MTLRPPNYTYSRPSDPGALSAADHQNRLCTYPGWLFANRRTIVSYHLSRTAYPNNSQTWHCICSPGTAPVPLSSICRCVSHSLQFGPIPLRRLSAGVVLNPPRTAANRPDECNKLAGLFVPIVSDRCRCICPDGGDDPDVRCFRQCRRFVYDRRHYLWRSHCDIRDRLCSVYCVVKKTPVIGVEMFSL